MKKRIVSVLLVLSLLVSMLPTAAWAKETPQAEVNTGGVTVSGTNGFGQLLSEDIDEELTGDAETAEEYPGGYTVIGLTIEGNIATVEYSSLEDSLAVVSLYTEDGRQMLLSGKATAPAEEASVTVTLEGELPEYFMASAYLLDNYDYSPLCPAYDTPLYTKDMQELLASTVEDYEEGRVLNLDEDNTTNFAVYADETIVVEYIEGANTVASADDEAGRYVIENADEQITGLQAGQVFVYAYEEDAILIVKVETISVSGSTVTVTGADVEMEEVFSHVKIEGSGDTADMVVDETGGDEGVTYLGLMEESTDEPEQTRSGANSAEGVHFSEQKKAWEGDASLTDVTMNFEFDRNLSTANSGIKVEFKGLAKLNLNAEFSYYISKAYTHLELKANMQIKIGASLSGSIKLVTISLFPMGFTPAPGVFIGFEPEMQVKASASVSLEGTISSTVGVYYHTGEGIQSLNTMPKAEWNLNFEGTIFIGFDLAPKIKIVGGKIAEVKLSALAGVELQGKMTGKKHEPYEIFSVEEKEEIHNCDHCLALELYVKLNASASISLLKCKALTFEMDFGWKVAKLNEVYYSQTYGVSGEGSCPYKSYRVAVTVPDAEETVEVFVRRNGTVESVGYTTKGLVVGYVPKGFCTFYATVNGAEIGTSLDVTGPTKIILGQTGEDISFTNGAVTPEELEATAVIASGTCGENLTWELIGDGTLTISGTGEMDDYDYEYDYSVDICVTNAPWGNHVQRVRSVVISEGVTNIGKFAFSGCINLTDISISSSLKSIEYYAFMDCNSLKDVEIPENVTHIGSYVFEECKNLNGIWVDYDNESYASDAWGVLFDKAKTDILTVPRGISGEYIIPESVTKIDYGTFKERHNLSSVRIPSSVESIEGYAFAYCSSLSSITIPSSVAYIESHAFAYCESLTSVTIHRGVERIYDCAFVDCSKLSSVSIPSSVTDIGRGAFEGCKSIMSVFVSDMTAWCGIDYYTSSSNPLCYGAALYLQEQRVESLMIPQNVVNITDYAFYGCSSLTDVMIPGSVESIGDNAFCECNNLSEVTVAEGVTSIGNYAFQSCASLTNVTISEGVTSIGHRSFYKCSSLISATIPSTVENIGIGIFEGCTNLSSVIISEGVTSISNETFDQCSSLTSVSIPSSVTDIGSEAFRGCSSLRNISIPHSVKYVDSFAFSNCDQLCEVYITDLAAWCSIEFSTTYYSSNPLSNGAALYLNGEKVTELTIPEGVTSIGDFAFYGCTSLTGLSIPESVTNIGSYAFTYCVNLANATIHSETMGIGDYAFYACSKLATFPTNMTHVGGYAFAYCESLASVAFSNELTSIGGYAFYGCDSISSVEIPESVTDIGWHAFDHCGNLSNVGIPEGIVAIGDSAFRLTNLINVIIPSSVTHIGSCAFQDCYSLATIRFCGNAPYFGSYVFSRTSAEAYYPAGNATWTSSKLQNHSGNLIWISYTPGTVFSATVEVQPVTAAPVAEEPAELPAGPAAEEPVELPAAPAEQPASESAGAVEEAPTYDAVFGGEYSTVTEAGFTVWTAAFADLVPGAEYVLLALASLEAEDPLSGDNLLYIDQVAAGEDGTLTFTYIQRQETGVAYVMACGASNKDLADAQIEFPCMSSSEEPQETVVTVTYDGEVLQEGRDYVLLGAVDYSAKGEYKCYVRGIRSYTGLVECKYTVLSPEEHSQTVLPGKDATCTEDGLTEGLLCACGKVLTAQEIIPSKGHTHEGSVCIYCGDFAGDGVITDEDVRYLLWHTLFPEDYPVTADADFDGDGAVSNEDVCYLLWHTLFPEDYPV